MGEAGNDGMKNYWQIVRGLNRDMRLYLLADGLSAFTVDGGIYAVIFNLYLLRLGYRELFIGSVNGLGVLAYGVFSLVAGWLGSRFSTRKLIGIGLGVMALGCAALPCAEWVRPDRRGLWLILTYVVTNLGLALHTTNGAPFLTEISQVKERPYFFSLVTTSWSLAGFAGNLIGGLLPLLLAGALTASLTEPMPYRFALWLTPMMLVPAAVLMFTMRTVTVKPRTGTFQQLKLATDGKAKISLLAFVRFLFVMSTGAVLIFLNLYLDKDLDVGAASIGLSLGFGRFCAAGISLLAPLLAARWSKANLILLAAAGTAVSMLPLILVAHASAALISFMGVMTLLAIRMPTYAAYAMEAVPPGRRAFMAGASEMANGLGFAVIGLGGGVLISAYGYRLLFLLSACLTVLGAWLFARYCRPQPSPVLAKHAAASLSNCPCTK
jgi:MFS family permease